MVKKPLHDLINKLSSTERKILFSLKERGEQIIKTYGSLAKAGRPIIESKEELAVLYKIIRLKVSYSELARFLGVSKVTIYRIAKGIENGVVAIYNRESGVTEKISISINELEEIIKKIEEAKAKKHLSVVTDSKVIQEFIKKPVRIQRSKKKFYNEKQVKETIAAFQDIADYIKMHKEELRARYDIDVPSNPDLWLSMPNGEEIIADIVMTMCLQKYPNDNIRYNQCKAKLMGRIKRVKEFRNWFQGLIGAVTNRVRPKESTLYYRDIVRLKQIALSSDNKELEAFYWIAVLHVTSGSREGWDSIKNKALDLQSQGVQLTESQKQPLSLDLDNEFIDTSLIGIKWNKVTVDSRSKAVVSITIFERKTGNEHILQYVDWVDEELPRKLYEFYEYARERGIKSVVKTILHYYNVKRGKVSVDFFKKWYTKWCGRLQKLLNLPYKITPHRLRSAHASIGAELRIPLELLLDSKSGFGVGWDDLKTAKIFYLRFSKPLILDYLRTAKEIKEKLSQSI